MQEQAICPHCCKEYNKGAALCYHCNRYINFKGWIRVNWQATLTTIILILLLLAVLSYAGDVKIVQKTYGNQSPAIIGTNKGVINIKRTKNEPDCLECKERLYHALESVLFYENRNRPTDKTERVDAIKYAIKVLGECKN